MRQDITQRRTTLTQHENALFLQHPLEYRRYALEWCSYPHWTIEEAANLLTGCVPHREMLLRGQEHACLDEKVLATENLIRAALHSDLTVVKSVKYFGKTYLHRKQIFEWAETSGVIIPHDLIQAEQNVRQRDNSGRYTTPCLEATRWVIDNFWLNANLREPPTSGAIIHAMLQAFPELSGEECDWVEKVTRHPLTRLDHY